MEKPKPPVNEETKSTGRQTQRLLLIGFGGLLLLLAFSGFNAVSVLSHIQTSNENIRQDYVNRDAILEELRSDIYLSGTYVRDFLLEPDPNKADAHRAELNNARSRIEAMVASYQMVLRGEERPPFEQFRREVTAYFDSLQPALQWDSEQRKLRGYSFMQSSLLPRRMIIVRLADQIGRLNQEQMNSGNERVRALFSTFRTNLVLLVVASLIGGLLLAWGSIYRILRLERLSALRFDEALQARKALRELSARLVEVQETERRALSRELHDEVGQALSALLLALGNAAALISPNDNPEARSQLLDTRRLAEKTVAVVRDMCLLLRPSMLDDLGLVPALEWQAREVSRTSHLRVAVEADAALEDLSDDHKTCIYRVVQEALRNVTRHAKAKQVQIALTQNQDMLHLVIKDDGCGFTPDREKGVGLLGMEERVRCLNGKFLIRSAPHNGTAIDVMLPTLVRAGQPN
jgi:signal transduction histidine kinase